MVLILLSFVKPALVSLYDQYLLYVLFRLENNVYFFVSLASHLCLLHCLQSLLVKKSELLHPYYFLNFMSSCV